MHIGLSPPDLADSLSLTAHEENFWPSFTDVMMVVVIVFLLSSTVAILHSWDLAQQVQETKMSEQEARDLAQEAQKRAQDLDMNQALLQLELGDAISQMEFLHRGLLSQTERLKEREEEIKLARLSLTDRETRLSEAERKYAEARTEMQSARQINIQRERELLEVQREIERMQQESQLRERRFVEVEAEQRQTQEEMDLLQKEYDLMNEKYTALIRPARSSLGKAVAAVRYRKVDGQPSFMIRSPTDGAFRAVEQQEMHRILAQLKQEYGGELFVRVVIPTDSNLSYQEAWQFSIDMLEQYDYYYQ